MKYSCTRLAPKHDVADAEAAEQWPRKEADEATGSLGRESKFPGRTVGDVGDWLSIVHTLNRGLNERLQHFASIQSERGRSQIKHPAVDDIGIVVRILL